MIILLSPSKTLDETPLAYEQATQPRLLEQSQQLIHILKEYDNPRIQSLMKISEKLAELNARRYHAFSIPFTNKNAKPAALAFKGDVYEGLEAWNMNETDLAFAQQHLRILSGLYGLLRPLDLLQPYRLEMGTKLENQKGKNLYEFWGNDITNLINEDLQQNTGNLIVNLASNEYFKAVKKKNLDGSLINISFKEEKDGKYKVIAFYAKKARGMMAKYIIQNQITTFEALKGFNEANYTFQEEMSSDKELVFVR